MAVEATIISKSYQTPVALVWHCPPASGQLHLTQRAGRQTQHNVFFHTFGFSKDCVKVKMLKTCTCSFRVKAPMNHLNLAHKKAKYFDRLTTSSFSCGTFRLLLLIHTSYPWFALYFLQTVLRVSCCLPLLPLLV